MYRAVHSLRKASTKQVLKDGGKVGGKSGRLTAGPKGAVTRLSELDRNAIRKNVNRESADNGGAQKDQAIGKMQHSIQAVLYHSCKLTNNEERHRFCPPDDSCKFRSERKMDDKPHHLDPVFCHLLKPVFDRLSEKQLIERCLPGYSQNQNKSFNSFIWKRAPKHTWRWPNVIRAAVNIAVIQWNVGQVEADRSSFRHLVFHLVNIQKWQHNLRIGREYMLLKQLRMRSRRKSD